MKKRRRKDGAEHSASSPTVVQPNDVSRAIYPLLKAALDAGDDEALAGFSRELRSWARSIEARIWFQWRKRRFNKDLHYYAIPRPLNETIESFCQLQRITPIQFVNYAVEMTLEAARNNPNVASGIRSSLHALEGGVN